MYLLKSETLEKVNISESELKELYDRNRLEFENKRSKEIAEMQKNIEKNQEMLMNEEALKIHETHSKLRKIQKKRLKLIKRLQAGEDIKEKPDKKPGKSKPRPKKPRGEKRQDPKPPRRPKAKEAKKSVFKDIRQMTLLLNQAKKEKAKPLFKITTD